MRKAAVGFFGFHGIWAPGVRLFRAQKFRTNALVISAVFMVPICLLAASLWSSTQETIDFADKERAGVIALRAVVPVYQGVLEVRNATRATLGGFDATNDYRVARDRTDARIAALKSTLSTTGDPIGLLPAVSKLESAWRGTSQSANGADAEGRTVFGPVTESLVEIMAKLGDDSNLVLDPGR